MIRLPVCPSVNALYRNVPGKGRVKTAAYKSWQYRAGWILKIQRPAKITGPYELEIRIPRTTRGDASNRVKAAEDLLVAHGITPDDRKAERVEVRRADVTEMQIEVRAA